MPEQEQITPQIDWRHWITRWDAMQTAYLPHREERFNIMLEVVEQVIGGSFVALDVACGPGAISQRLLARFPQARCVAVDYDPALLALGQGAFGDADGRLRWVEADLREPGWIERLGETRIDAVLSTTALHWLDAGALTGSMGSWARSCGQVVSYSMVITWRSHRICLPFVRLLTATSSDAERTFLPVGVTRIGAPGGEPSHVSPGSSHWSSSASDVSPAFRRRATARTR